MIAKYLLDTNALLRYLRNDIPKQSAQVTEIVAKAKQRQAIVTIPVVVFMELVFALWKFYGETKEAIGNQLFTLASNPVLDVEKREIVRQAFLLWKEKNVSFVDCFLAIEASIEGKTLFTFDEKLKRLASAV